MAYENIRLDSPRQPEFGNRILDHEDGGLSHRSRVDLYLRGFAGRLVRRIEHISNILSEMTLEDLRTTVDFLSKHGFVLVKLTSHVDILGSLSRKEEHDTWLFCIDFAVDR